MTVARLVIAGAALAADPSGALWWPELRLLAVADLHLEKGSRFAERGAMLPPYDTRATIERLARLLGRYRPRTVLALGDSFHDRGARERLGEADAARLRQLTAACDWVWIAGNHDPMPPADLGGRIAVQVTVTGLTFRHEPGPGAAAEVCGHLHPKAAVRLRHGRVCRRCFVTDGRRLILPAFGAYAGGLDVHDPAIAGLFRCGFRVLLLGEGRVHAFPAARLLAPAAERKPVGAHGVQRARDTPPERCDGQGAIEEAADGRWSGPVRQARREAEIEPERRLEKHGRIHEQEGARGHGRHEAEEPAADEVGRLRPARRRLVSGPVSSDPPGAGRTAG